MDYRERKTFEVMQINEEVWIFEKMEVWNHRDKKKARDHTNWPPGELSQRFAEAFDAEINKQKSKYHQW